MSSQSHTVILFYKFIEIDEPEVFKNQQLELCESLGLTGRLLIASEGINGTFEGLDDRVQQYMQTMKADDRFSDIKFKTSAGNGNAFPKLKIKVRDGIVTLKPNRNVCPAVETATELTAEELQAWYEADEDFVVLDLRNEYEIASGYFEKTIDPGLRNFRDLDDKKIDELANDPRIKGKKVLTVCTGGIRCEKATCLMNDERFPDLYQLKDGIHDYMEKFPNQYFRGTLFVFDNRNVVDLGADEQNSVISTCQFCDEPTKHYVNDDSKQQSEKILCCENCYEIRAEDLRPFVAQ